MLRRLLGAQPVLITTVVTAAVGLAVAYGAPIPPDAKAPLIALLVALATVFVHQSVVSPATVVEVAGRAAAQTAEALGTTTVGAVGSITDKGTAVVVDTVDRVVNEVGGLVGALAPTGGKSNA